MEKECKLQRAHIDPNMSRAGEEKKTGVKRAEEMGTGSLLQKITDSTTRKKAVARMSNGGQEPAHWHDTFF